MVERAKLGYAATWSSNEFVNHPLAHYLGRGCIRSGFTGTILLDTFKARSLLGYADVVPPGTGLAACPLAGLGTGPN